MAVAHPAVVEGHDPRVRRIVLVGSRRPRVGRRVCWQLHVVLHLQPPVTAQNRRLSRHTDSVVQGYGLEEAGSSAAPQTSAAANRSHRRTPPRSDSFAPYRPESFVNAVPSPSHGEPVLQIGIGVCSRRGYRRCRTFLLPHQSGEVVRYRAVTVVHVARSVPHTSLFPSEVCSLVQALGVLDAALRQLHWSKGPPLYPLASQFCTHFRYFPASLARPD